MNGLELLKGKCIKWELVGSRVTCDPAPVDTDQDVLVLASAALWDATLCESLAVNGFEKGGSDCGDQREYLGAVGMSFQSFTLGDLNLIVTFDPVFYDRFRAATMVAKRLNLLRKDDRIMLFQAVLYGTDPDPCIFESLPVLHQVVAAPEYVQPFWVTCNSGRHGCVEALVVDEAKRLGGELLGEPVTGCEKLPYPANPRLNKPDRPPFGVFPSFCYSPGKCKGHGSCPQRISCTE